MATTNYIVDNIQKIAEQLPDDKAHQLYAALESLVGQTIMEVRELGTITFANEHYEYFRRQKELYQSSPKKN